MRYFILKRDGGVCQLCGRSRHDGFVMNVDHIKARRRHPELSLDPDNLQTLCSICNRGKGSWDDTDWRTERDQFDAEWRAIVFGD